MAQRFPAAGPSAAPPSPQQAARYPAQPPTGSPLPPRPYPGPNFPQRGAFPAGGGPAPGGPAAGVVRGTFGAAPPPRAAPPTAGGKRAAAAGPAGAPAAAAGPPANKDKRRKRLADKILPQQVRDLVPESQAYMDLLAFERKLDHTIMRKRLDIQEALKRPMKQKRKLRIFISNTFYPAGAGDSGVSSWELRVEGRLLDDQRPPDPARVKRKFSSFFKSLVIELDKELYGPDNHLVEWHRTHSTQETDGFQVKRPGYKNVRCTILLLLDYQPLQFKLDARLARLLGVHTQTRPVIVNALWQYVKTHGLQDPRDRDHLLCDRYLERVFEAPRLKLAEVPARLHPLLHAPDPIVINHVIAVEAPADGKQTACYDIDVEVDDSLKAQMNSFLLSTANQQEIQALDAKVHETVDTIHQLKTNREFFLSFSREPQPFVHRWLASQARDLRVLGGDADPPSGAGTNAAGAGAGPEPEEERRAEVYGGGWTHEAVHRYLTQRVLQRRAELDAALHVRP